MLWSYPHFSFTKTMSPGKSHREGITLVQLIQKFPDDATAEAWFAQARWPDGIVCPHCGSSDVNTHCKHPTMPYRCRNKKCRKHFSTRTGTVMECSRLGFQIWAIAIFLIATNLKGISSMKLHRDLGITQKSAWFLAHRIRESFDFAWLPGFDGPIEADETFIGGKRKNMSHDKRKEQTGRGPVGKAIVAGIKDRKTGKVSARVVKGTDATTLKGFVRYHVDPGTTGNLEKRRYEGSRRKSWYRDRRVKRAWNSRGPHDASRCLLRHLHPFDTIPPRHRRAPSLSQRPGRLSSNDNPTIATTPSDHYTCTNPYLC